MKITSFSPLIITKNMEPAVNLFEEIGFERRHKKEGIGEKDVTAVQMRSAGGFDLDISQFEGLPVESLVSIRMNVDDFDEAYNMLTARIQELLRRQDGRYTVLKVGCHDIAVRLHYKYRQAYKVTQRIN